MLRLYPAMLRNNVWQFAPSICLEEIALRHARGRSSMPVLNGHRTRGAWMFCRNCGSKIEDGAQFCAVYGASVVPDDQAQTGGANPLPVDAAAPIGSQQVDMAAEAAASSPKRSKKPFIIAAVVVALLAVGGGAGYYFGVYAPEQTREAAEQEALAAKHAVRFTVSAEGGTHRLARAGCRCTSPARRRAARRSTSFAMSTARERASSSVAAAIRPRLRPRPLQPMAPSTPCRAKRPTSRLARRRRAKRASMPATFRSLRSRQPK